MFECPVCGYEMDPNNYMEHMIHSLSNEIYGDNSAHSEYITNHVFAQIVYNVTCGDKYAYEIAEIFKASGHIPAEAMNEFTEVVAASIQYIGFNHRKRMGCKREASIEKAGGVFRGVIDPQIMKLFMFGSINAHKRKTITGTTSEEYFDYIARDTNNFDYPLPSRKGDKVEITRIFSFAAAHHLPYHKGLCRFTHGHEWKLEVTVRDYKNEVSEMVLDFSDLKKAVNSLIIDEFDHNLLNDKVYNPTAENLCEWIWRRLSDYTGFPIYRIKLWESENSFAVLEKE